MLRSLLNVVKCAGTNVFSWLDPWAGKVNQILHCDWLPEQARGSSLTHSGLPAVSRKKTFRKSHVLNPLLTRLVQSIRIGLILCLFVFEELDSIWVCEHARIERNLSNLQPSWPHTWSITHIYCEHYEI